MNNADVPGVDGQDLPPPSPPGQPAHANAEKPAGGPERIPIILGLLSMLFSWLIFSVRPGEQAMEVDESMVGLRDLMSGVGYLSLTVGGAFVAVGFLMVVVRSRTPKSGPDAPS